MAKSEKYVHRADSEPVRYVFTSHPYLFHLRKKKKKKVLFRAIGREKNWEKRETEDI